MEYRLRAYVDQLFENAPRTQRAYELKIELTQNLLDKYYSLVSEGKSEQDAYNLTVMSIGDVRELFEGLDDAEPMQGQGPAGPSYKVPSYGEKRRAGVTAIAVMMYILSVVPLIIFGEIGMFETLGVVIMLVMVALATGILIYNNMSKQKNDTNPGTVVSDFKNWQSQNTQKNQLLKAIRSAYWPLVLAVYFVLSFMTGKWEITWIIFLIAPAVDAIIKALLTLSDK